MEQKKNKMIVEMVEKLRQMDSNSLVIMKASVDILAAKERLDKLWKDGLKEKYRQKLLTVGKIAECFVMPDSIIPEIYGTIERQPDGTLYTTKAQRTGCSMCGFGIHMEKRPHRFDMLYKSNPKEWDWIPYRKN